MNYKKGITRLFIIGLIASPLVGIFMNGDRYTKYRVDGDTFKRYTLEDFSRPRCAEIAARNPATFPDIAYQANNNCLSLSMNWDDVKKYQAKQGNPNAPVTEQVIRDAISSETSDVVSSMRNSDMLVYTIGYLICSLIGLIAFFIIRWVIKGFKSQ